MLGSQGALLVGQSRRVVLSRGAGRAKKGSSGRRQRVAVPIEVGAWASLRERACSP
jgi:hypothetical protein